MKKILSFLAAGALALGLIGCPGVLHDKEVVQIDFNDSYYLLGDMTNWEKGDIIKFTKDEADATKFWAKFNATDVNQGFDFAKDSSWTGQIGGNNIVAGTLGKDIEYELKDNGFGGVNATLSGLVKGNTYKMVAYANAEGKVAVDVAESKEPKYFLLDGYFIRSLDDSWNGTADNLLWNPVKDTATGEVTYKVKFTAKSETQQLALARQDWGAGRYECSTAVKFKVNEDVITLESGKEEHPIVTGLIKGRPYNVVVKTAADETVSMSVEQIKYVDIVGLKIINAKDYEGIDVYFLEGWIPNNEWNDKSPNKATVKDGTAEISIASQRITQDSIPVQMIAYSDKSNFWADGNKIGGGTIKCDNTKDFVEKIIVYDCSTKKISLTNK